MASDSSAYLTHLPSVFREARPDGEPPFLGEFLKIIEALLAGRQDARDIGVNGIEDVIEQFPDVIDPAFAPLDPVDPADPPAAPRSAFLDYLASWAALTLDQNWSLEKKREWTRRIVPLYKRRGTRAGLQEYLDNFVGGDVFVDELPGGFILADPESSTLGVDTFLSGAPAYYFRVGINYAFDESFTLTGWLNIQRGTRAIIDLEKPAHTYYTLIARTPGFRLGISDIPGIPSHTVLGRETLIWGDSNRLLF